MYQKEQITLAIVTKNRPKKLRRLLFSITKQTRVPTLVIVVDNDSSLSAMKIVKSFTNKLSIRYLVEPKPGVPFARNLALKHVKTRYLAFVDDDCILSSSWFLNAELVVKKLKKISYFVGSSFLFNSLSKVALAQYVFQKYWFLQKLEDGILLSPFNIDTKNIIFKVADLQKNKLNFDTNMSLGWFDSADTDMGFSMQANYLRGVYIEQLKVWHEESNDFVSFINKAYYRGRLAKKLVEKWKIQGEFVNIAELNFWIYLKSLKNIITDYEKYFSIYYQKKNFFVFMLIKIYERVFLIGFIAK